jgi:hypothetical protein
MRDAKLFPLLESSQHITASHNEKKIGDIRHKFENRAIFRENVHKVKAFETTYCLPMPAIALTPLLLL